jgi:hypothetical protein
MRRRDAEAAPVDGPTRRGVEEWLTAREAEGAELAPMLVASARLLAAEVDRDPSAAQTWSRFLEVVRELLEPEIAARQWSVEQRVIIESVALARADGEWRGEQYRKAVELGEPDPEHWLKVVPISCVWGEHSWKRPDYWKAVRCQWCDAVQSREES